MLFSKENFHQSLGSLAFAILPVMGSMHFLKVIFKTTSRIPFWKHALSDPAGVETATALLNGSLHLDRGILHSLSPVITIVAVILPVLGLFFSFRLIVRNSSIPSSAKSVTMLAALIYSLVFEVSIVWWRIF